MLTKTTFKDSKKVKRIRNYVLKSNLYLYVIKVNLQQKLLISGEKMLMLADLMGFIKCFIFWIFFT